MSNYHDYFKLHTKNDYFLSYLFPSKEIITRVPKTSYNTNSIIHKKCIVFSDQGMGKSELVRTMLERAIEKYGINNVNSLESGGNLEDLLLFGLNNKLVNIHFCDDFSLKECPKNVLEAYFKIRHLWKKEINRSYGLIVSIFGLHRFHSSIKEIRSTTDCVIIRNDSLNPYDHSVIKGFIGAAGLEDLHFLEEYRDKYPELKNYSIFTTRSQKKGLLYFPLAKKNYFRDIKEISSKYSKMDKIFKKHSWYFL